MIRARERGGRGVYQVDGVLLEDAVEHLGFFWSLVFLLNKGMLNHGNDRVLVLLDGVSALLTYPHRYTAIKPCATVRESFRQPAASYCDQHRLMSISERFAKLSTVVTAHRAGTDVRGACHMIRDSQAPN